MFSLCTLQCFLHRVYRLWPVHFALLWLFAFCFLNQTILTSFKSSGPLATVVKLMRTQGAPCQSVRDSRPGYPRAHWPAITRPYFLLAQHEDAAAAARNVSTSIVYISLFHSLAFNFLLSIAVEFEHSGLHLFWTGISGISSSWRNWKILNTCKRLKIKGTDVMWK